MKTSYKDLNVKIIIIKIYIHYTGFKTSHSLELISLKKIKKKTY